MTRALLLLISTLVTVSASPVEMRRQIQEQERQIRQLETEVERLRWLLEREKIKNSGEPMLLPEDPDHVEKPDKSRSKPKTSKTTSRPSFHTVRKGENMYRISLRHGVSLHQLQAANPSVDPKKLRVGQRLRLAAAESSGLIAKDNRTGL